MAEVKVAATIAPQDIIDNETLNSINDNHAYIDIIELRIDRVGESSSRTFNEKPFTSK